jgi:hypothetical protein
VKRLDPTCSFYRECFGLGVAEDYCVLESGGWTLSLVLVPAATVSIRKAT